MARTGVAIKIMGGLGALWLLFIIVSASQPHRDGGSLSAQDAMAALVGFEPAFPPRPIPPMTAMGENGPIALERLATPVLVTLFIPKNCRTCDEAIQKLADVPQHAQLAKTATDVRLTIVYIGDNAVAGGAGDGITSLRDPQGQFARYAAGNNRAPLLVVYTRDRGEVGRITGNSPWTAEALGQFVEALAAAG